MDFKERVNFQKLPAFINSQERQEGMMVVVRVVNMLIVENGTLSTGRIEM